MVLVFSSYVISAALSFAVATTSLAEYRRLRVSSTLLMGLSQMGTSLYLAGSAANVLSTSKYFSTWCYWFVGGGALASLAFLTAWLNVLRHGRAEFRGLWFPALTLGALVAYCVDQMEQMVTFEPRLGLYYAFVPPAVSSVALYFFAYQFWCFAKSYHAIRARHYEAAAFRPFRNSLVIVQAFWIVLFGHSVLGYLLDLPWLYFVHGFPATLHLSILFVSRKREARAPRLIPQVVYWVFLFDASAGRVLLAHEVHPVQAVERASQASQPGKGGGAGTFGQVVPGIASILEEALGLPKTRQIRSLRFASRELTFAWRGELCACALVDKNSVVIRDFIDRLLERVDAEARDGDALREELLPSIASSTLNLA